MSLVTRDLQTRRGKWKYKVEPISTNQALQFMFLVYIMTSIMTVITSYEIVKTRAALQTWIITLVISAIDIKKTHIKVSIVMKIPYSSRTWRMSSCRLRPEILKTSFWGGGGGQVGGDKIDRSRMEKYSGRKRNSTDV